MTGQCNDCISFKILIPASSCFSSYFSPCKFVSLCYFQPPVFSHSILSTWSFLLTLLNTVVKWFTVLHILEVSNSVLVLESGYISNLVVSNCILWHCIVLNILNLLYLSLVTFSHLMSATSCFQCFQYLFCRVKDSTLK